MNVYSLPDFSEYFKEPVRVYKYPREYPIPTLILFGFFIGAIFMGSLYRAKERKQQEQFHEELKAQMEAYKRFLNDKIKKEKENDNKGK